MKFECLKCGDCCRNLLVRPPLYGGKITLGLFLTPNKSRLFPKEKIAPMYGAGIKGRSRLRPKVIFGYQLTEPVCPHLGENNLCDIYDSRPITCRAYPMTVTRRFTLGLNSSCSWIKRHFPNSQDYEPAPDSLDVSELKFWIIKMLKYMGKYAEMYSFMWIFDLKTRKWYRSMW